MQPTVEQVKAEWRGLLDDDAGRTFTDAVFTTAFSQAYDAMIQAFDIHQCSDIDTILKVMLPPYTKSLTPADAGIADFAEFTQLRERLAGSTELFRELTPVEQLTQRDPLDRLVEFAWQNNTFYFIGATTQREIEITFQASGTAPLSGRIPVDGCLSFLANFAAGKAGSRKGYDEIAKDCMAFAVGPKYDAGVTGGELFRMIQHRVRNKQHEPIAPRPYSAYRRGLRRAVPFIAAQQPQGVGLAPVQFSTADGTITGTLDGTNSQFFLSYPVSAARVYRNGDRLTGNLDYTFGANVITFLAGAVPQAGDVITADGWL